MQQSLNNIYHKLFFWKLRELEKTATRKYKDVEARTAWARVVPFTLIKEQI